MTRTKKILAWILLLCMILGMVPSMAVSASAEDAGEPVVINAMDYGADPTGAAAGDDGSQWAIYEVQEIPTEGTTQITFTGVKASQTSVRIGDTGYNVTVGDSGDANAEILLGVGQSKVVIDKTGDFSGDVDESGLNQSVATVAVRATVTDDTRHLSEKVDSLVSGRQYLIFNTRSGKPVTNANATAAADAGAGSGLLLSGTKDTVEDAAIWILDEVEDGKYTLRDANGKYMTIGSNRADLSDAAAELTIAYNGSTWTISQNGAYLNHFGGQGSTCAAGWQDASAAGDAGSQWEIYEVITTPGGAATEITVTGISVGETSVRVGNTTYRITVSSEHVSVVTLNPNYSGAETDTVSVFTGSAVGELPVPMRPGHTFFGWYLNGTQVDSGYVVNEDITLVADWVSVSTKERPANGTTTGQPFPVNDANGNAYCYRIPGIVTLDDGTVIAMSDHRWNTWADCGGLDTIVSVSSDNGKNWTYTFANYLGDNGDTYNPWSTTFIDPAIATDGTTAYMIADLFPAGVSTMAHGYASQAGNSGFDAQGRLILRDLIGDTCKVGASRDQYIPMATSRPYDFYLNPETDGTYTIRKAADDSVVEGYTVDAFFNIRSTDGSVDTHLFKADSPYQVYPTNYLYMNTSADGLTWSAPRLLNLKTSAESAFLVGPGTGTYDPNTGCMIFTAYCYSGSAGSQRACLIWMDEEGNWTRSAPATDSQWSSEASAVVLSDGTVRVFFRDQNTLLSYTDYEWADGAYVRDENNVRVTTAAAKNGGNGCMLSALRYSKPINGKEAVMVATPATANSRSDGHIYVFLVNADGTMDLAYDYDITGGAEYYAYSCLTELKSGEEAGSLALFWEDSWNNSPAAATIRYSVIPMDQVITRDHDVLHTYVDAELTVGESAAYTDNTGDYTNADTSALDPDVASVAMTVKTEALNTVRTLGSNTNMDIANCLFTFTASGNYYVISRELEDGTTVYLNHFGTSHNNIPLTESSNVVAVTNGSFTGMFQLQSQIISGSSGLARTLHFHMESATPYWNRCGGDTSEKCHEYLFRPANEGEDTTGSHIPGYVQLTDVSQIVSGGQYLIAARNDAGNWYVLNPIIPANYLECVAQVMGQTNASTTEITFTGIGEGKASVQIGNTIYNITVTEAPHEPVTDCADTDGDGKCDVCGELIAVIRVAGAGRWQTALLVADEMKAALGDEKFDAIIIASGNDFADALAGSYLATVKNAPILLSYGGDNEKYAYLDNDNINYVKENLAEDGVVYILGGEKAVPTLYEDGLEGYDVVRLGGANRFETNILILEEAGIADGAEVLVCTSANFADSLSASATGKPILLVWNDSGALYGSQPEFLSELKEKGCTFTILGGENAVSAKLADEVAKYGEVDRLAGNTRMETSVLVAEKYFDAPETAVLAYAWNYPDGLCGGSLAYALKAPLILTMPNYEAAAVDYAAENDITVGYVLGGDGLIGDAEVRAIFAMAAEDQIVVKN